MGDKALEGFLMDGIHIRIEAAWIVNPIGTERVRISDMPEKILQRNTTSLFFHVFHSLLSVIPSLRRGATGYFLPESPPVALPR